MDLIIATVLATMTAATTTVFNIKESPLAHGGTRGSMGITWCLLQTQNCLHKPPSALFSRLQASSNLIIVSACRSSTALGISRENSFIRSTGWWWHVEIRDCGEAVPLEREVALGETVGGLYLGLGGSFDLGGDRGRVDLCECSSE